MSDTIEIFGLQFYVPLALPAVTIFGSLFIVLTPYLIMWLSSPRGSKQRRNRTVVYVTWQRGNMTITKSYTKRQWKRHLERVGHE